MIWMMSVIGILLVPMQEMSNICLRLRSQFERSRAEKEVKARSPVKKTEREPRNLRHTPKKKEETR